MIIRVPELSEEVRHVDFQEPAAAVNEVLASSPRLADQRLADDVAIDAELYRHGSDVYFSGRLEGQVHCTCTRCLDEFEWSLARDFKFLIVKAGLSDSPEDDTGVDHYSGDELDLGPLVREQTVLAMESSVLCSDDCKGLCAGCGANLNSDPCTCEK